MLEWTAINPSEKTASVYERDIKISVKIYNTRQDKVVNLFTAPYYKEVEPGDGMDYTGSSAFSIYSPNYYDKICIHFDPAIQTRTGEAESTICNSIEGEGTTAMPYMTPEEAAAAAEGGEAQIVATI